MNVEIELNKSENRSKRRERTAKYATHFALSLGRESGLFEEPAAVNR